MKIQNSNLEQKFSFYIRAKGKDQNAHDEIFSELYKIELKCGATSTKINAPVLAQTEPNEDYVEMIPPNDIYKIVNFKNSNSRCPIESVEIEQNSGDEAPTIISNITDSEI